MKKRLTTWLMRPITMLILPSASTRTYRLRLPAAILILVLGVWIASVGSVAFVLTKYTHRQFHYEAMRQLNAHLVKQNELYAMEVAKTEALAKRLAPLERELHQLIARPGKAIKEGFRQSGQYHHPLILPNEIPNRVSRLVEVGAEIFGDYQELTSLAASTPSTWPLRGWITSAYGERISPSSGEVGSLHQGVDIANKRGSPIAATADGLVLQAEWTNSGYGKLVHIVHGYGYSTIYGHCDRLKVEPGDRIKRGDIIAYVGSTGNATGPHCHYEVRLYGVPVSPRLFMN